jgi:hypothetical protein
VNVALTAIEPGAGVAGAVKLQKLELVGSGGDVATHGPVVIVALPLALLVRRSHSALCCSQSNDHRVQFLLLGSVFLYRGLKCGHLVLKGLQGLHLHLNGI